MPDDTQVKILRRGVNAWNQWRQDNPSLRPILREASLIGANLATLGIY
ncbi:MAG TPA: hypothetical protein VI685_27255 [Candidatus Angelobacter sp.]